MSILNVVVVRLPEGAAPDNLDHLESLFHDLSSQSVGVLRWDQGPNAGLVPGASDFGAAIVFEDEAALQTFLVHPVHASIMDHLSAVGAASVYTQVMLT